MHSSIRRFAWVSPSVSYSLVLPVMSANSTAISDDDMVSGDLPSSEVLPDGRPIGKVRQCRREIRSRYDASSSGPRAQPFAGTPHDPLDRFPLAALRGLVAPGSVPGRPLCPLAEQPL